MNADGIDFNLAGPQEEFPPTDAPAPDFTTASAYKNLSDEKLIGGLREHADNEMLASMLADTLICDLLEQPKTQTFFQDPAAEWPVLSPVALPGFLGEFVQVACRNSEADPAAVAATFIIRFGIECGAGPYYNAGETRHTTRLNAVIVGDSSKSRKGTSAGPVKAVFDGLELSCKTSPGPLSTGEGLINAVRDEVKSWIINKKSGVGEWQVVDPGIDDKRLFVLDEEFSNALNAAKREGNTLSGIIRGLYDSGDAAPLTKSNKITCTGAHVGIVAHTTQSELKLKLSENDQLNGFGNRFLWVCAKRQGIVPFPKPIPDEAKQLICGIIHERRQHAFRGGDYRFGDEARELWIAEYPRLSMAHDGLAGCMINRGEAHTVRLALIYAILSLHTQIERDDLAAALAFWQYCEDSALYLFGGEQSDRRKMKILNSLNSLRSRSMTKTDIIREVFNNHITKDVLDQLLNELSNNNLIKIENVYTKGAPKTIISIPCEISEISEQSGPIDRS